MNERHLHAFVVVAEEGSLSKAARKLFVSQPALTQQMNLLEASLGFAVIERSNRGVTLTPAGRAFLREAKRILALMDGAVVQGRLAAEGKQLLNVGVRDDAPSMILTEVCATCTELFPSIEQQVVTLSLDRMLDEVEDGAIDVTEQPEKSLARRPGLAFEKIVDSIDCCVMSATHRLANRDHIDLADLDGERMATLPEGSTIGTDLLRARLREAGLAVEIIDCHYAAPTQLECVLEGYISIMPYAFARNSVLPITQVCIPFPWGPPIGIGLLFRKDPPTSVIQFIEAAKVTFAEGVL